MSITTFHIDSWGLVMEAKGLDGPYVATRDHLAVVQKLSGQLEAAEQHVRILQEQRASLEPAAQRVHPCQHCGRDVIWTEGRVACECGIVYQEIMTPDLVSRLRAKYGSRDHQHLTWASLLEEAADEIERLQHGK
jgi:hypothetical protein